MKKFKVVTLGCRTNQYESQAYVDQLLASGFSKVEESEEADLCIVNTCTVTQTAHTSSFQAVKSLAKKNPMSQIIVTGCAAQKNPEMFQDVPGVVKVVLNAEKEQLLPSVFPEQQWPEFAISQFEAHTRAFVKIQDGCNSYCTYCIIPYVRGRSRSRREESILEEIDTLVENGFKEIVLTGINIGDFDGAPSDEEKPFRLSDLVKKIDQMGKVQRLRLSSIDPDEVDEELIEAIVHGKSTCPSMHIVLQSGSNAVLKRMNRKYTAQMFLQAVERLKSACSEFTFTTDVIVGFPGETDRDFADTLDIVRQVRFAKVHMFPYSKRERTRAALYPDQVPLAVMQERKAQLLEAAESAAFALRQAYVGRSALVLLENKEEEGTVFGHTDNFLPVYVEGENLSANQMVQVRLIENTPKGLRGALQ